MSSRVESRPSLSASHTFTVVSPDPLTMRCLSALMHMTRPHHQVPDSREAGPAQRIPHLHRRVPRSAHYALPVCTDAHRGDPPIVLESREAGPPAHPTFTVCPLTRHYALPVCTDAHRLDPTIMSSTVERQPASASHTHRRPQIRHQCCPSAPMHRVDRLIMPSSGEAGPVSASHTHRRVPGPAHYALPVRTDATDSTPPSCPSTVERQALLSASHTFTVVSDPSLCAARLH